MLIKDQIVSILPIESPDDLVEARLEATGYIFHGTLTQAGVKRGAAKAGTNLLHFARCAKLDKAAQGESKFWFRTIGVAKAHLDETVGPNQWKWCKVCEKEITQKLINEQ